MGVFSNIGGAIKGTWNKRHVLTRISKSVKFKRATYKNALKKYDLERKKLIEKFDNHAVTEEIEGGVFSANSSNTLGGKGNLFTYIGFKARTRPTSKVRAVLQKSGGIKSKKPKKTKIVKPGIKVEFTAKLPDTKLLKANSPMPWQEGRSWLFDIESGISGFNYYLVKKWSKGRSGQALQAKGKKVRGGSYMPPSSGYIRNLLSKFAKSFR